MIIKRITRILFHPTTIKIFGFMVIIWFLFILPTFAQGTETTNASWIANVQEFLNYILKLCSRWRVILAILAGKLMTNDRVYASIIHMDIYLWKIWNIMKNFANFALVGIVLYNIIQNIVGKDKINIKDIITKTLVAGILIQASRFLVGALVDISTIATSAVGAFPSSFLHSSTDLQKYIKDKARATPTRFLVDIQWKWSSMEAIDTSVKSDAVIDETWDEILPTYNSVSGPLIYLGFSVFKFQNYMNVGESAGAEELTISFLLRVIVILFYTLGLALLFIANIIRVAFLWIFVIAAPLIVLSMLFFKDKAMEWWGSWWIGKYLSFKVMLDLIFKPVIFVAGFSMILIFVISIQKIMQTTLPKEINGVTISVTSWASTLALKDISTIKVTESSVRGKDPFDTTDAENIKETWQTIFVNLILFFLTIFLMREFIKISATSGTWPVADVMKKLTKNIEDMAKTLPILPLAGGTSITSAKTFATENRKKMLGWIGLNKDWEFWEMNKGVFTRQQDKFKERLTGEVYWKPSDYDDLDKLTRNQATYEKFFTDSTTLSQERKWWLSITNDKWLASLQKILQNDSTALWFKSWTRLTDTKPETLKAYFNNPKNAWNLYKLLWWKANVVSWWTATTDPQNYEQLKGITFWVPANQ